MMFYMIKNNMKIEEIDKKEMKIVKIPLEDLVEYEHNNKIHTEEQIERIANSLKEFWWLQPIVVENGNVLVAWHGRVLWAKKLGLKYAPAVRAEDLTPEQIRKYRIWDNKLNESEWDIVNLNYEMSELWDLNLWDLKFSKEEVFPELDFPDFNPDDFEDLEGSIGQIKITVFAKDEAEAELIRKDLAWLGYEYK